MQESVGSTKSGLLLPSSAEKPSEGEVVAIGPGSVKASPKSISHRIKSNEIDLNRVKWRGFVRRLVCKSRSGLRFPKFCCRG